MHILLVKVQHKILDEKVDDLINHLTEGLQGAHYYIETGQTGDVATMHLIDAFGLLLDVLALQTDFAGYFRNFPTEAKALTSAEDLPTDEHHRLYELLKECLLDSENHYDNPDHALQVFAKYYALRRPFFEPYFNLWRQVKVSKLQPSPRVIERLAYGALCLLEMMVEHRLLHGSTYRPTVQDTEMMLRYNQNRVISIDEALMQGNFDADNTTMDPTNHRLPCIKCGSYGQLQGYVEHEPGESHFIAYGFVCNHCGMELFDQKDLLLAGIKPIYHVS